MKTNLLTALACAAIVVLPTATTAHAAPVANSNITESEVEAAQKSWGAALLQISSDYKSGGIDKARQTAEQVIDAAYGYNHGPVLFKPTLTTAPKTFRPTR